MTDIEEEYAKSDHVVVHKNSGGLWPWPCRGVLVQVVASNRRVNSSR